MKRLILSIVTVLLISTLSLGQTTGNTTTSKDSTKAKVELPVNVAKAVVKDILRKDSCEKELDIIKTNLQIEKANSKEKDKIISNKDQEIGLYKQKENNYLNIINNKDIIINNEKITSEKLVKELKQTKRRKTRNDILGGIIIIFLAYLSIK